MEKEGFNPTPVLQGIKNKLKKPCRNNCGRFSYNVEEDSLCYRCLDKAISFADKPQKKTKEDYITHEFEAWTPGRKNRYLNIALKTNTKLSDKKENNQ